MNYRTEDWSFAELSRNETLWGTHGYHRYPAKFIPQLARRIIDEFARTDDIVGDVFLGSGTTGVEAIRAGCHFYGSDINPVACLISQAKCIPIEPKSLESTWQKVAEKISSISSIGRKGLTSQDIDLILSIEINRATPEERLIYWFPQAYRQVLTDILQILLSIPDRQHQIFMLCAFSNILKRCSTWLSGSTKAQKDLNKTIADPIDEFPKQVRDMVRRNRLYWEDLLSNGIDPYSVGQHVRIEEQDARCLPEEIPKIDLLVTSPPYATCYEYSELHQLTQLWFEKFGIIPSIGSKNKWIGSRNNLLNSHDNHGNGEFGLTGSDTADEALFALTKLAQQHSLKKTDIMREVRALVRYFLDMNLAISQMSQIVPHGKHMVLVIGDSRKRDIDIPTTQALSEMSIKAGFTLHEKIMRKVPGRVLVSTRDRGTGKFSSAANSDVQVYPEENILVFRRI